MFYLALGFGAYHDFTNGVSPKLAKLEHLLEEVSSLPDATSKRIIVFVQTRFEF